MSKIENILWDFNGTLLNDVDVCIESINPLLIERKLKPINKVLYKEVFTFPVKEYYKHIGFDFTKEAFEIPAMAFIENYKLNLAKADLFPEVELVLKTFQNMGIKQFVLSAMEEPFLRKTLKELKINTYFNEIAGIQDYFAKSKINRGIKLLETNSIVPEQTLLIGDTLHDAEVANELGVQTVLVANGHQSKERLRLANANIVEKLIEIESLIKYWAP